jgi:hypothetical protein
MAGMISTERRLRFAVALARERLDKLTPRQLATVRRGIAGFLLGGAMPLPTPGMPAVAAGPGTLMARWLRPEPDELSRAEVIELQRAAVAMLQPFAEAAGSGQVRHAPTAIQHTVTYTVAPGHGHRALVTLLRMSPLDTFRLLLAELLREISTDRLRLCPEDGALFLRVRGQRYCSARCTDRANKRAWRRKARRTDEQWRQKENERKRLQYRKQKRQRSPSKRKGQRT